MKYTAALAALPLLSTSFVAVVSGMPEAPPALKGADNKRVPNPHQCGFVYGDPHIFSFDQEAVDCRMGAGDYLYSKSKTTPFEIQIRHVAPPFKDSKKNFEEEGWYIGTGAQAIVINTGVHGEPVVEINAYTEGATKEGQCSMSYLFDGVKTELPADATVHGVTFERRETWEKSLWDEHWYTHHYRNFYFESGVFVQVTKKYWKHYGCFMNIRLCIPDEIKAQGLYGILGNANGNPDDDFRDLDGKVLSPTPKWGDRDTWCNKNWCIAEDSDNMFQVPKKVEKDEHVGTCSGHTSDPLDEAVKNASPLLKKMCDDDPSCIFDTLASGDVDDGLRTLIEKEDKDKIPKETDPQPEDEQEQDICSTPEGNEVDCDPYEFEFKCEAIGYDFGFQMEGCNVITSGLFHDLTLTDKTPTCNVGGYNVGSYDMTCSGDGMEATITPMVDGVVKVSGSTTGMLYTDFEAGKTYTLTTGPGTKKEAIENIEFCFKCPVSIVNHEVVKCAADVKTCKDTGSEVKRDPHNDCQFAECPQPFKAPPPDSPSPEDKTTNKAFSKGDPHFKTFGGELYDYHGECDLVLLHNPDFKNGLGMDIHIRTKIEAFWSAIETAAIRIGEETLEITANEDTDEWLWFNGKELGSTVEDGEWSRLNLSGHLVRFKTTAGSKGTTREANIYLNTGSSKEYLLVKTFKNFVRIDINHEGSKNYDGAVGLLGSHEHNGKRLGRDGAFIEDTDEFGQEWQVRPEVDGKLFHSYEGAVVGKQCKMPPTYHVGDELTTTALRGRRLGAASLSEEQAEKACNHLVDPEEKKACVFDVIATQDLNMASTW